MSKLIFYQIADPTSSLSELSEKEITAYNSYFKPLSLSTFKDFVKRIRNTYNEQ